MNLEDTIYRRQSIRSYDKTPLDNQTLDEIRDFIANAKELNPNIKWSYEILPTEKISTMMRWKAPHYLVLYSQEKENYYQNIGFIFQQVDLYLQSREIGTCWIGMASPKGYRNPDKSQKFIIAISLGRPQGNIYRERDQFNRKSLDEISDRLDERLIPAQLAPSATNAQPWYFTHNDDGSYDLYRVNRGMLRNRLMGKWSRIDTGIALAHLYLSNRDSFRFYMKDNPKELKGLFYDGSFKI
ncbi:MAG: nitroreductase [Methanobrevibacter olleyae]|uniref:Nitroreductase n=1 Tax=Methanobrevibacter olleyae TaxID=294671 RepID=A0A8T3VUI3_METOL|nr:nitroreductase [Methanobrevibacter olleyae]